ncbi:MAG TPA: Rieske 2Fe-2S domain-containing protein [Solirubrobacteraceae bacterium]|jgi:ubiquinol-cytochrome c reductase iron-sulfur subunit
MTEPVEPRRRHRLLAGIWKLGVVLALWRSSPKAPPPGKTEDDEPAVTAPSTRTVVATARAEFAVAGLLVTTMLLALGFALLMVLDANTQLLALAIGGALAAFGLALAIAGARLVPQVTAVEARPIYDRDTSVSDEVAQRLRDGVEGVTRRRMLAAAGTAAVAGLAAAIAAPLIALGPGLTDALERTPWRRGRRLVDAQGAPVAASALEVGGFLTAFPEGADPELVTSSLILVRVDPSQLRLPRSRMGWAPRGIVAYSKICTHAGCAVSLFRSPLSATTESGGPALVCPCHYSTFDVLNGGSVEFGPAGRPLPQLPLEVDRAGNLRAKGRMSGPIGPSWWGDPA